MKNEKNPSDVSSNLLRDEENGVKWYSRSEGRSNVIHTMMFDGIELTGSWVGPRWIFMVLSSMDSEERAKLAQLTHDEWMGVIRLRLKAWTNE